MLAEKEAVRAVYTDGVLTVSLAGEIDHHTARPIREEIDRYLYRYHPEEVVLSLGAVSFMDSSGLGLILGRLALCRHFGCRLRIIDADERVMKIFLLSGMERIEGLVIEGLCEKEGIL
jgi:stage II sporulation protein AA (anti-sigma F factor antagonist)